MGSRAQPVLRLAYLLTGDRAEATRLAVRALAAAPRWLPGGASDLDRRIAAGVVRTFGRRNARAPVVLAFGLDWDPASIAEACRRSQRSVRADVTTALRTKSEDEWRAELYGPAWDPVVPPDLTEQVGAERARRRGVRGRRLLALTIVATAAVASDVAVHRAGTGSAVTPTSAHVPGLLSWPARGDLVRDRATRAQATNAWRSVAPAPSGQPYFLYAGLADGKRLAVLEGYFEDTPALAVVTNGHLSRLVPLATVDTSAVAITYDSGAGAFVSRLLVAPTVTRVAVRSSSSVPQLRPPFTTLRLTDGLSQSWPTPGLSQPWSAIRLTDRDGNSTVRVLTGRELIPSQVRPVFLPPPVRWVGLPFHVPPAVVDDDAVWFAQICAAFRPRIQPVWAGRVPSFSSPIRVERVRCAGQTLARFLTGSGSSAVTLREVPDTRPKLDVYAAVVSPPGTFGPTYVVLVGSRRVGYIRVGGKARHTRVVVVRLEQSRDLRVFATDGTRIAVR